MPYVTEIPSNLITVGVDGTIAIVANTQLVNAFQASQEFDQYDVDATGATSLTNGDNLTPVDSSGNAVTAAGTYLGGATFSTAAASVDLGGLAGISLSVNDLEGSLMQADGRYYFISEQPVDEGHINVTASIELGGSPISVTGPISDITETLADAVAGVPLVGPAAAATIRLGETTIQNTANAAAVTLDNDPDAALELTEDEVYCFVSGTLIQTRRGPVAVEALAVGDEVLTRDNGFQPIRWTGSVTLSAARLARNPKLRPIRIRAGALGQGIPASDLLVSPQHRILVRSKIAIKMFGAAEVLVPAKQLLQWPGIDYADDLAPVEYHHFLFDRHEVVISNGAETESLFTRPEALKSVGPAARQEILALFPILADRDHQPEPARCIPSGRLARKLTLRHIAKDRDLVI